MGIKSKYHQVKLQIKTFFFPFLVTKTFQIFPPAIFNLFAALG